MSATVANTPTRYYLDTPAVKKACKKDFEKIDKACKPDDQKSDKNKHPVLRKMLGKRTMDRLDAMAKKVKDKYPRRSTGKNAWMSHCDGLWIKPSGAEDMLEDLEAFNDLVGKMSSDLEGSIKAALEPLVAEVKAAMTDKALDMAMKKGAKYAVKTGARHGAAAAGAAIGGIGVVVTEGLALLWTIGDGIYTGYDVIKSGYDIYAAVDEMEAILDIAKKAQGELADLAKNAANMSPTDMMANGMGILSRLNPCTRARRCLLVPYSKTGTEASLTGGGCCPGQTGHHVIPDEAAKNSCSDYNLDKAPTICVEGANNKNGTHGMIHQDLSRRVTKYKRGIISENTTIRYAKLRDLGIESVQKTFPESKCDEKCLKAQLDAYYKDKCKKPMPPLSGVPGGGDTGSNGNIGLGNK